MQDLPSTHLLKRLWLLKYAVLIVSLGPILDLIQLLAGITIFTPAPPPETVWMRVLLILGGALVCISLAKRYEFGSHARKALMFTGFGAFALIVAKVNPFIGNILPLRLLSDVMAVTLFAIGFFEACKVRKAD